MKRQLFKKRLGASSPSDGTSFILPSFVVELEPSFVLGARVDRSKRQVRRVESEEVSGGSLEPFLNQPNFLNAAAVEGAVRKVGEVLGTQAGRLGLLVPDPVVRVTILPFEALPDEKQDLDALVRWRLKELLPFAPQEARVSYQMMGNGLTTDSELLTLAAKKAVLAEYERAVEHLNGGPILTLPATAALLPLLPEWDGAGQVLIHVCPAWLTTVVLQGSRVRAWRTRDLSRVPKEQVPTEVGREAARAEASSRDKLGLEVRGVRICARPPASDELVSEVAQAVSSEATILEPRESLAPALSPREAELFRTFGATVAGLLRNSEKN